MLEIRQQNKSLLILLFLSCSITNYTFFVSFSQLHESLSIILALASVLLCFINKALLYSLLKEDFINVSGLIIFFLIDQIQKHSWLFLINRLNLDLKLIHIVFAFTIFITVFLVINLLFCGIFILFKKILLSKIIFFTFFILEGLKELFYLIYFFIFLGKKAGIPLYLFFLPLVFQAYKKQFQHSCKIVDKNITWQFLPKYLPMINHDMTALFLWINKKPIYKNAENLNIYLTPESFFKESLNLSQNEITFLKRKTVVNEVFFLCGYKNKVNNLPRQGILFLKQNYSEWICKKLMCPIYEKNFFSNSKKKFNFINFNEIKLLPLLCSEFFLHTPFQKIKSADIIILPVKIEYMPQFIQNILFAYSILICRIFKKKIIFIDNLGLRKIDFSDRFITKEFD